MNKVAVKKKTRINILSDLRCYILLYKYLAMIFWGIG